MTVRLDPARRDEFRALREKHGWSIGKIADFYGMTEAQVTHSLKVMGVATPQVIVRRSHRRVKPRPQPIRFARFALSESAAKSLLESAEKRRVSSTDIVRQVIEILVEDKLIDAVLDDGVA